MGTTLLLNFLRRSRSICSGSFSIHASHLGSSHQVQASQPGSTVSISIKAASSSSISLGIDIPDLGAARMGVGSDSQGIHVAST